MQKKLMQLVVLVVLVAGTLTILDIWFNIFSGEVFGKVLMTAVILVGMVGVAIAVRSDIDDETRKKKEGFYN